MNVVKEVRQPCLDIDSGKFAVAHNRVHHSRILWRIVVLAEEVVLARQLNWTLPVLDEVGVYPVPAVDDIAAQAVVVVDRIVDGLAYRTLGKDLGGLVLEPYFKRLKYRDRKTHAEVPSLVVCQVLVIGLTFDLIQEANLFYGVLRACRVIAHTPVEPASRMGPAVKAQYPVLAFIIVVHGIAVRLERAPEVSEQPQRHVL